MTSSIAKPIFFSAAARGKWITAGEELHKCCLPSRSDTAGHRGRGA